MGKVVKIFALTVLAALVAGFLAQPAQAQYNAGPGFKISWALNPRTDANFRDVEYFGSSKVEVGMDFDRDGRREILFATDETLSPAGPDPGFLDVYLYEAAGNDQYEHVWHYTMPEGTNSFPALTYGDIDSDGKWEIYFGVPTINNPNKLFIFEQDDTGAFPANPTLTYDYGKDVALDFRPSGIKLDDVDGDGKIEIITQSRTGSRRELVVAQLTTPTLDEFAGFAVEFSAGEDLLGGGGPYDVDVADFDGDGLREIWYNTWDNFSFTIFEATGPDAYALQVDLNGLFPEVDPGSFNRHKLLFANVDADAALEAWFPMTNGVLYFLDNVSDVSTLTVDNFKRVGKFFNASSSAQGPRGADVGDIDRDGRFDIIVNTGNSETIHRIEYLGIGSPADSSSYAWTEILESAGEPIDYWYPLRISPVDLDGDGLREVVITNRYADDPSQPLILVLEYDPNTAEKLAEGWEPRTQISHTDAADPLYASQSSRNSRSVIGGFDLDQDGKKELIVTDYAAAAVRVFEYDQQQDVFEQVWASPVDTADNYNLVRGNPRVVTVGDLDGDNKWEIIFPLATLPPGWRVFEWDGVTGSDNYGTTYSSLINTEIDSCCASNPNFFNAEHEGIPFVLDVDNDGKQEILLSNLRAVSGGKRGLMVTSVIGDIEHNSGGGFETWVSEFFVDRGEYGGGSPFHAVPADLDGDGTWEIINHTFNFFNLYNVDVLGADSYQAPDPTSPTRFFQATAPRDTRALFGGATGDADGDGNDEAYFVNFDTGDLYVVDYNPGDDVLSIDGSHVVNVIPRFASFSTSVFDVDKNGRANIFSGATFPRTIVSAELAGNNPRDPSGYVTKVIYSGEPDIFTGSEANPIDIVVKDSLGIMTTTQTIHGVFAAKVQSNFNRQPIDFDNDGDYEIIACFQGNQDSIGTLNLTWNTATARYDSVLTKVKNPKSWSVQRFEFTGGGVGVEEHKTTFITPDDYVLEQNYPNPFNPATAIRYTLPINKRVSLRIYDMMGRVVRTLVDDQLQSAGRYEMKWDGKNVNGQRVASGVYIYSLEFGNFKKAKRMTLVK
ncbi:T9SS C-terminal target domain-containing protein [candidate division KSB1 bacterium]|nr:MAG: T9SS C-terminal target domain-containing protein [candidate division KSB1 bacterium]MBC6946395.1 T9SS C-terminal target domain-containing protein [candidate division KSB1 bacterium]MCE7941484.1 T9SS C-terminal target domain-containing protein [Chlorobi bacterium CHB1]MDL1875355.1 T9SS type A sorting domain-containing protein [Cytophagia bacterium CHB2]